MEQKQRGKPLLPIQRAESPVLGLEIFGDASVDEVKVKWMTRVNLMLQNDGEKSIQQAPAHILGGRTALGIIPLDDGNLDL